MSMWKAIAFAALLLFARAAAADDDARVAACVTCHHVDRVDTALPLLEGQNAEYLATQLQRFRDAHRTGFPMESVAQALAPEEIRALARHFAALPWTASSAVVGEADIDAGRARVARLQCANCHLAGFAGSATIPRLAGQHPEYLARQLRAFGSGRRYHPPTGIGSRMYALADDDVRVISRYLASRGPQPEFGWLEGRWCAADDTRITEQAWLRERGGLALGVHRETAGPTATFQFLRIEVDGTTARYVAQPHGQPAVVYELTDSGPQDAEFTSATPDAALRIRYERTDDELVQTRADGTGGTQRLTLHRECRL